MANQNRLKIVRISHELLRQWLSLGTDRANVVQNPLPNDAVLVASQTDGRTLALTYQSDSFPEVDGMIPELSPAFARGICVDFGPSPN